MAVNTAKLGPGILSVGEAGTLVDFTCQVTGMKIEWNKDADDDVPTLCGDVAAGAITYTAKLTGTVFQDYGDADGIGRLSWAAKGTHVPFTFVPSLTWAQQVEGTVTIDPLDFGGDDVGANMDADLEWDIVGEPIMSPYDAPGP